MFFCVALMCGLPHAAYGQADSTQAAGAGGDSLQLAVKRETQKIPTVAHKGRLVDAATGSPVQGGIVHASAMHGDHLRDRLFLTRAALGGFRSVLFHATYVPRRSAQ